MFDCPKLGIIAIIKPIAAINKRSCFLIVFNLSNYIAIRLIRAVKVTNKNKIFRNLPKSKSLLLCKI
ncbi:MAG TPA: hypothetical protein DCX03_01420 [Bacteroidales bacterium]|nr:hypothetical protein [Bacteroidales bacterium]